jgi:hypothetical protein
MAHNPYQHHGSLPCTCNQTQGADARIRACPFHKISAEEIIRNRNNQGRRVYSAGVHSGPLHVSRAERARRETEVQPWTLASWLRRQG